MGLEDRQYYREDSYQPSFRFSAGGRTMVVTLVIINVVIFALDAFSPKLEGGGGTHWLSYLLAIKYENPWQLWTYLTYGFAHASYDTQTGFWHVAFNMFALWMFGRSVEMRLGRFEFLKFYLIAILASGIGFTLIHLVFRNPFSFIVGASGAVTAVVVLFIFMYPRQTLLLFGIIPMPAWLLGVLIVLSDFATAFNPNSHTAWEAHLIGAAFGAAYFRFRWDFGSLKMDGLNRVFSSRPKLKIHDPETANNKLKLQADQILQKISEHGEESLTAKERKTLNKYSAQLRKNRT
jgi:membrane associated rhomboid family serine protease